jgi:hypothetical protein
MQGCVRCASPSRLALCTDPHADQCPVPTDGVALSALQVSVIHGSHELDLRGLLQPGIAGFPPSLMMLSHLTSLVLSQCERTRASSPPPRATSPPLPPPRAATWQVRAHRAAFSPRRALVPHLPRRASLALEPSTSACCTPSRCLLAAGCSPGDTTHRDAPPQASHNDLTKVPAEVPLGIEPHHP